MCESCFRTLPALYKSFLLQILFREECFLCSRQQQTDLDFCTSAQPYLKMFIVRSIGTDSGSNTFFVNKQNRQACSEYRTNYLRCRLSDVKQREQDSFRSKHTDTHDFDGAII